MILGKPKCLENYICVNSEQSCILHKKGFIPIYREIGEDKIYYLKTDKLEEVIKGGI